MLSVLTRTGAAQEDPDRKLEELKREHDKALRALREKFEQERARLEKEFRESREKALRGRQDRGEEKGEPGKKEPSKDLQARVRDLEERVERLERKLRGEEPFGRSFGFRFPPLRRGPEGGRPWESEERLREILRKVFEELEHRGVLPSRPFGTPPKKRVEDRKKKDGDEPPRRDEKRGKRY
jgi:hypothetical protein